MSEREHAIYLSFDDKFLSYVKACLSSLRDNFPGHPRLIVDYMGEDADVLDFLAAHGAEWLPPRPLPEYARHFIYARAGAITCNRLKLWRHDFDRFETILHLDADTLVLKPLDDLFETPTPYFVANFESAPQARLFRRDTEDHPGLRHRLGADGLRFPGQREDMVNAGVFALPRAWRSPRQIAALAWLAQRYGSFFAFADQSLLSLWLLRNGLHPSMSFRDNFQTPMFTDPGIEIARDDIRIMHFSSGRKPGTPAFERWERVGSDKDWLLSLWRKYAGSAG
jgi:hypothetical protein